jgi:hypothetical protein
MVEPELVKLLVTQTNCNYAHPFTQLALLAKGASIRMLKWLDGARTTPKT